MSTYVFSYTLHLPGDSVSQLTTYEATLGDFLVFVRRAASSPKVQVKMTTPKWTQLLLTITGCRKDTGEGASHKVTCEGAFHKDTYEGTSHRVTSHKDTDEGAFHMDMGRTHLIKAQVNGASYQDT